MEPVHWIYVIFTVPIALGALAYIAMQIILKYKNQKKQLLDSVVTGEGRKFSLMADMHRMSIVAWYVYESDEAADPTPHMLEPGNSLNALLITRYTLAVMPRWHGRFELFDERYLALSMGGLLHSLYDIDEAKTLVHEADPQACYAAWADGQGMGGGFNEEVYARWVHGNLHEPIEALLKKESAL